MSKSLRKGVYYMKAWDCIVYLTNVRLYEDEFNPRFAIATWEDSKGVYEKTLIKGRHYDLLVYLGSL